MSHECPNYVIALLKDLENYLCTCYWNKYQKKMNSPFQNTGETYKNDIFEVRAYDWNGDNEWNFKYYNMVIGEVTIYWYKYLGRATTSNKELEPLVWVDIYNRCRESIKKDFGKYAPDSGEE